MWNKYRQTCIEYIYTNHPLVPALRIPGPNRPRLLLVAVLRGKKKLVAHFGLPCASWVLLSRGTTARSWLAPLGDVSVKCVADANLLCSRLGILKAINLELSFQQPFPNNKFKTVFAPIGRMCLLIILILAHQGNFTIEQPSTSLIFRHPRFRQLISMFKVPWV